MTDYSVDDAANALGTLIHRAARGETIAIVTESGTVARIVVDAAEKDMPVSAHDVAWLDRVRIKPRYPFNSVETIREMRSEYRY
ncbi:hypothetical protein GVN18_39130 [Pseudomonas sp. ODNR1LW]|nr:hypothetical protein [Pseudomonas sp. ODNR1LW]